MAFGEGISVTDLFQLLNSIRERQGLILDVKILDGEWRPISVPVIKEMILTIRGGKIEGGNDIRLRLHGKEGTK